ncbi:MAG: NTP transferase domain-containing protein [Propionibacteriaceae bacterium]|nr:NTP transferase domain-containing protein [Propionibacteriaceae bacterium]
MNFAVIMAGGSGTRLWPLSRQGTPKQLLELFDGRSLLQMAFDRAAGVVGADHVLVCAGRSYADLIRQQLPALKANNLLSEPIGRDSLAAIAWSMATLAQRDATATVAILSADQIIEPIDQFQEAVRQGLSLASSDDRLLVTLGVIPTSAHTGYGYLHVGEPINTQPGAFHVAQFAEKPSVELAQEYLQSGEWWWNSGMFCWQAATFRKQLEQLQPNMAASIDQLVADPGALDRIYPGLTRISVDFAIMEPVSNGLTDGRIAVVPLTARWADVGDFESLADQLAGAQGNATVGPVVTLDSRDCLLWNDGSQERLLVVAGLSDLIVVNSGNVTLVCPKNQAQSVKALVDLVRPLGEQYV